MNSETETLKPEYRYQLKAKIIESGYRTLTDFSEVSGIDISVISRIVSGMQHPGPKLQRVLTRTLGITSKDLRQLL